MRILIFAGTKNGRELVERLNEDGHDLWVSSMSAYGDSLLPKGKRIRTTFGKKKIEEIQEIIRQEKIHVVIDSTHPYAVVITENIRLSCTRQKIPYLRYGRQPTISKKVGRHFASMEEVYSYLSKKTGNILFTTGVNEVPNMVRHLDRKRIYVRVLPVASSLEQIRNNRLDLEQVIQKKPPFSLEENIQHIQKFKAKYLVTKDSGEAGNTKEKIEAVEAMGIELLVIDRPEGYLEVVYDTKEAILEKLQVMDAYL